MPRPMTCARRSRRITASRPKTSSSARASTVCSAISCVSSWRPGDPVVTSRGSYPTFGYHVAGFGGVAHAVPYRADRQDLDALLAARRETGARLIYLANPDNPMGGWFAAEDIANLIAALPADTVLCLDEAYADFMDEGDLTPLDMDESRVIRMRTFSKAHGLAGARVGYALGRSDLIAAFDRVRNHFGVGRISQAGALAALEDRAWLARVVADVTRSKARLASIARANGLAPLPSATNFVTMDCGRDGDFARRVLAELGAEGVFVRMPFVAPEDRCIRVTAGLGRGPRRVRGGPAGRPVPRGGTGLSGIRTSREPPEPRSRHGPRGLCAAGPRACGRARSARCVRQRLRGRQAPCRRSPS